MSDLPRKSQFLIYQAENGAIKIDVRFEDETVWLTQQLMAELFQTTQQNISLHLQNVYAEEELVPQATNKKFLSVRREGTRDVQRQIDFYNLDAIISVGYRVKSRVATQFRIWATQRLRPHAQSTNSVRAVNDRLAADQREAFPEMKGFSPRNLKYMRAFAAA